MAKNTHTSDLIIEWDPAWVRVLFLATGQVREAAAVSQIEGISSGQSALLLLSRGMVLHRVVDLPDANKSDVLLVVGNKLHEIFPIAAGELAYDVLPTAVRNENGRATHVFAAKIPDVVSAMSACESTGVTISRLLPASLCAPCQVSRESLNSAVVVERFGERASIDVVESGEPVISKLVWLDDVASEVARLQSTSAGAGNVLQFGMRPTEFARTLSAPNISALVLEKVPPLDLEPALHREERKEKERKIAHRRNYFVLLLGLTAAYGAFNVFEQKSADSNVEQRKANSRVKLSQAKLKILNEKLSRVKGPGAVVETAFQPAQRISDIAKIATMHLPRDGSWLNGFSVERGKIVTIRGTAKTNDVVNAYLDKLTQEPRLRSVRLVAMNSGEVEKQPVVQFSISAFPVGNIPIIEPPKKKKK